MNNNLLCWSTKSYRIFCINGENFFKFFFYKMSVVRAWFGGISGFSERYAVFNRRFLVQARCLLPPFLGPPWERRSWRELFDVRAQGQMLTLLEKDREAECRQTGRCDRFRAREKASPAFFRRHPRAPLRNSLGNRQCASGVRGAKHQHKPSGQAGAAVAQTLHRISLNTGKGLALTVMPAVALGHLTEKRREHIRWRVRRYRSLDRKAG